VKEFDLKNLTQEEKDLLTDWFNEQLPDDRFPWSPAQWQVDYFIEDGDYYNVCEIQGKYYIGSTWRSSEDMGDIDFDSIEEVVPYEKVVTRWKTV